MNSSLRCAHPARRRAGRSVRRRAYPAAARGQVDGSRSTRGFAGDKRNNRRCADAARGRNPAVRGRRCDQPRNRRKNRTLNFDRRKPYPEHLAQAAGQHAHASNLSGAFAGIVALVPRRNSICGSLRTGLHGLSATLLWWLNFLTTVVTAQTPAPHLLGTAEVARSAWQILQARCDGWQRISIPDFVNDRWPNFDGVVW